MKKVVNSSTPFDLFGGMVVAEKEIVTVDASVPPLVFEHS